MAEETDHTLELLRRIRSESSQNFDRLGRAIQDLASEVRVANAHIVGLVGHENYASGKLAELESRLERVEKRLELSDPTLP